MNIGGFIKNSFVDFPNNISSVIFTNGCNFVCDFCHNSQLISGNMPSRISLIQIFDFLLSRKGLIDGVVITGGEPTIQPDLKDVIIKIKKQGFLVKLDTNGSNPEILADLLNDGLLDYVAMDIKTVPDKYDRFCKGVSEKIKKSIEILKLSNVDHEFRTTFEPELKIEDIESIAKIVGENNKYYIQKYNLPNEKVVKIPHSVDEFKNALMLARKFAPLTNLRGIDM